MFSDHSPLTLTLTFTFRDLNKQGDEIAWSHNEECLHAFHVNCIIEWLIDNDECPMCRSNYICSVMNEFPIGMPNEIQSSEVVDEDDGEG